MRVVVEFLSGPRAENPHRMSKPLRYELEGLRSARRGDYRILLRVDDEHRVLLIVGVDPAPTSTDPETAELVLRLGYARLQRSVQITPDVAVAVARVRRRRGHDAGFAESSIVRGCNSARGFLSASAEVHGLRRSVTRTAAQGTGKHGIRVGRLYMVARRVQTTPA